MNETETQRRKRLAERVARIWDDERYPMALRAYLVENETKVAERDIAAMEPTNAET